VKARIAMRRKEIWSSGLNWWNLVLVLEECEGIDLSSMERKGDEILRFWYLDDDGSIEL